MGVKTYADPQGAIGAAVPDKSVQQRVYTRSDDAQTGKEFAQSVSIPCRASQQKPLDSDYPKTNYSASPIKVAHDYGMHSGITMENTAAANTMSRISNTNREFKPTMPTDMHSDSPSVSPITPVRYTDSQMPAVPRAETRVKTEKSFEAGPEHYKVQPETRQNYRAEFSSPDSRKVFAVSKDSSNAPLSPQMVKQSALNASIIREYNINSERNPSYKNSNNEPPELINYREKLKTANDNHFVGSKYEDFKIKENREYSTQKSSANAGSVTPKVRDRSAGFNEAAKPAKTADGHVGIPVEAPIVSVQPPVLQKPAGYEVKTQGSREQRYRVVKPNAFDASKSADISLNISPTFNVMHYGSQRDNLQEAKNRDPRKAIPIAEDKSGIALPVGVAKQSALDANIIREYNKSKKANPLYKDNEKVPSAFVNYQAKLKAASDNNIINKEIAAATIKEPRKRGGYREGTTTDAVDTGTMNFAAKASKDADISVQKDLRSTSIAGKVASPAKNPASRAQALPEMAAQTKSKRDLKEAAASPSMEFSVQRSRGELLKQDARKVFSIKEDTSGMAISAATAKQKALDASVIREFNANGKKGDKEPAALVEYKAQIKAASDSNAMKSKIEAISGVKLTDKPSSSAAVRKNPKRMSNFEYYKARYSKTVFRAARKAAALPIAVVMATVEEGIRDSGAANAIEMGHDIQTLALATFYMSKGTGAKLIKEGTGDIKNAKALEKFDKDQLKILKDLKRERNQLLVSINKELHLTGNIAPLLGTPDGIDAILARTDLTQKTRENLLKLKANLLKAEGIGTWLDQNARALDQFFDSQTLARYGVKSVGGLDLKGVEQLYKFQTLQAAQQMAALKAAVPAEVFEKIGAGDIEKFVEAMENGTLKQLLAQLKGSNASELADALMKNIKAQKLLRSRFQVMKGTKAAKYFKAGTHMFKHFALRKFGDAMRQTDVDGLHAMADFAEGIHNTRDLVRLSKSVGKGAYKAGKKTVELTKKVVKTVSPGRKMVDKQVNDLVVNKFLPKPKAPKNLIARQISQADLMKQASAGQKALNAVKQTGLKVASMAKTAAAKAKAAAQLVVNGVKAIGQTVATAGKAILPLIATPVGLLVTVIIVCIFMVVFIVLNVFCADDEADIQKIVDKINNERDEVVLQSVYDSFRGETDPLGNPYGYTTLDGKTSDNIQHGVTWEYENGISNNTAEIISLAAVYYQQNWPSSNDIANLFSSDDRAFFTYCRDLAGYALDVTARESHPYSCLVKGGCVLGYRDNGLSVTIKDYKLTTSEHSCEVDNPECGDYDVDGIWRWNNGHGEDKVVTETKVEDDGEHDVIVYFQNKLPDGANESELTKLPDEYTVVSDGGEISSEDVHGNLVIDASSCNLYKGNLNDWFVKPDDGLSASFTVVTHLDDEHEERDTYTVTFGGEGDSYEAIPWCPGELNDSLHGHYDLTCTVYLVGYDEYTDPCLKPDAPESDDVETDEDGVKGGTGTLVPLAHAVNDGILTRTVTKLNQYMQPYSGGTAARYTKTVTLPEGDDGFTFWYDSNNEDSDGNVAWAKLLYASDWEELYGVTKGIKCKSFGSKFTDEEVNEFLDGMDFSNISDGRQRIVAAAFANSGQFSYSLGSKPVGGPGNVGVKGAYDCSGYVRYLFWLCGYSFDAVNTADYPGAADLQEISISEMQPGDMQVMLSADNGGSMGHVRVFLGVSGGKAMWGECVGSRGSCVNSWTNAEAGMYNCRYYRYTGF